MSHGDLKFNAKDVVLKLQKKSVEGALFLGKKVTQFGLGVSSKFYGYFQGRRPKKRRR